MSSEKPSACDCGAPADTNAYHDAACPITAQRIIIERDPSALPALIEAGKRLVGAVEACAVAERGGPAVNWDAVDASQDAMRAALAKVKGGNVMTDNGLTLMLTLIAEKLQGIEDTLNHARMHFDKDEVSGDFVLEHNAWCPAMRRDGGPKFCACGYEDTHQRLRDAVAECEAVRASLNHALAKLEVAK